MWFLLSLDGIIALGIVNEVVGFESVHRRVYFISFILLFGCESFITS